MTGAITGLDITLQRISAIERTFATLTGTSSTQVDSDFQKILDAKETSSKNTEIDNQKGSSVPKEKIEDLIENYAAKNNLDAEFVKSVVNQESGFNVNATSKCGAMGLMQLMPATAKGLGVTNAYNAEENIMGGTKYLKGLMDRFDNNKELALAAYNAGPNAVKKYGGVPPYKETQNYVKSIMKQYETMKGAN